MRTRRLLVSVLLSVLVASCGGGDDEADEAASTSAPAATAPGSTTATASDRASTDPAKAAKARSAVLQDADFPPGWKADPEATLYIEETWGDLVRCLGVDLPAQPLGIATSPTYRQGLATQARSTVEYMPEPAAQALAAALAGPEFKGCATEAFNTDAKRSAPEGATPGPVEVTPLDYPTRGEATSASRINVTMNLAELQVPIFQDFLVFFDGEMVTRMFFLNPGGPFPPTLERTLVDKVLARA